MEKEIKYGYDQKLKAVLAVVKDYQSINSVAEKIGADKKEVRRWVGLYKQFGGNGLSIKNGKYSLEFKLSVIRYMEENKLSLFETSIRFGIPSDAVVRNWKHAYDELGERGFIQRNLYKDNDMNLKKFETEFEIDNEKKTKKELSNELRYLKMENEYLKKLTALVQSRKSNETEKKQ
jgi:transposase